MMYERNHNPIECSQCGSDATCECNGTYLCDDCRKALDVQEDEVMRGVCRDMDSASKRRVGQKQTIREPSTKKDGNRMMTKAEKRPWNNGFEAHERGFSLDHCPHEDGAERAAWIDGWNIAYETKGSDAQ